MGLLSQIALQYSLSKTDQIFADVSKSAECRSHWCTTDGSWIMFENRETRRQSFVFRQLQFPSHATSPCPKAVTGKDRHFAGVPLTSMSEDSVDEITQKRSHHLTQEQSSRWLRGEVIDGERLDVGSKYAGTIC